MLPTASRKRNHNPKVGVGHSAHPVKSKDVIK
jgi:hypothetical protein